MTLEETKQILLKYDGIIQEATAAEVKDWSGSIALFGFKGDDKMLEHGRWMCQEVQSFDDEGKANRWLGFVQGILVMYRIRGLNDVRDDTRPPLPTIADDPEPEVSAVPEGEAARQSELLEALESHGDKLEDVQEKAKELTEMSEKLNDVTEKLRVTLEKTADEEE